ncbi:MAG TPA: hypothetical protein DCS08_00465 [Candidatus Moranbacteria bacterium]|nr:hypothetical protein [Candidatus Moranbacteria bacterium]HBY10823.1 hypothetical protein [Candidatus Moranbacteria bacterium]
MKDFNRVKKNKQPKITQKKRRTTMKYLKKMAVALLAIISLTACSGGGGSSDKNNSNPPVEEEVYHNLQFSNDGSLLVKLAIKEGNVVNIVKDGKAATLPVNQTKRVIWNGMCGWPYKLAIFINNATSITELFTTGDKGLVTIESKSGEVYSINIDFVKTNGTKKNGLVSYGDGNPHCSWE